jgi:hypothetical protein
VPGPEHVVVGSAEQEVERDQDFGDVNSARRSSKVSHTVFTAPLVCRRMDCVVLCTSRGTLPWISDGVHDGDGRGNAEHSPDRDVNFSLQ